LNVGAKNSLKSGNAAWRGVACNAREPASGSPPEKIEDEDEFEDD